ncbi:Uncharacterised protein [Mycobacterium tuberculosis]|nr:Uncharacterised protein [Mycobacterium tuberculosis]CNN58216.1 Uncharacterised protein [Mycobacterium tuberculosis]COW36105.1 Uncharacterised protein [Mycobacterium tuberculosis]
MREAVLVEDLAQRCHWLGKCRRVVDARRPDRRGEERGLVGVDQLGQPGADGGVRTGCADPLEHQPCGGQPHTDQIPRGGPQRRQRARLQQQCPAGVDGLVRDAPSFEQLLVVSGQHDPRRRTVGQPAILLVLAERDDRVQVRGHAEHVVDRLVRAEPMGEYPPG